MPTLSRIDIFLDEVCPPLPDRDGWRRLKALDLGRVNLRFGPGGSLDSRKEEPGWSTEGFHELIENLKKETIPVGIWIPVALGGREWAVPPLDRLIDQLDALPLDPRDLIILIEDEAGVPPIEGRPIEWLDPTRLDPPATGFRERLRPRRTRRGVKIVSYKPEKQGF